MSFRRITFGLGGLFLLLCAVGEWKRPRPALDDSIGGPVVVLMSAPLTQPLKWFARHHWFAYRGEAENWHRLEVWHNANAQGLHVVHDLMAPGQDVGAGDAIVEATLSGEQARSFVACLEPAARNYEHRHVYRAWPGPNSNTFVEAMLRRCGFPRSLGGTAIGKDWRGMVGASVTTEGTGLQLESPLAGVRVGLREGLEMHVLTLSFGIDLWPPALVLPFGDGRFGFIDW